MEVAHHVLVLLPKAPFMSPWGLGTTAKCAYRRRAVIKYAANVYFAMKVNGRMLMTRRENGRNYENVRLGMAADHRIGDSLLWMPLTAVRFGGYCLPKDLDGF